MSELPHLTRECKARTIVQKTKRKVWIPSNHTKLGMLSIFPWRRLRSMFLFLGCLGDGSEWTHFVWNVLPSQANFPTSEYNAQGAYESEEVMAPFTLFASLLWQLFSNPRTFLPFLLDPPWYFEWWSWRLNCSARPGHRASWKVGVSQRTSRRYTATWRHLIR